MPKSLKTMWKILATKATGKPSTPSEFQIELASEIEASAETGFKIEAADEEDGKKVRGFSMLAYTGGKMNLNGFYHPVIVDLSGMKVSSKSRPILRDHDTSRIVGHTDKIEVNAGSIRVSGKVSAANEHAREIQESADNGFPWQASIGASADRLVFVDEGETVEVNGRKFAGPVYVARKSTLGEVSFVALGADDNTSARVAATQSGDLTMGFEAWLKAKGFTLADLKDEQVESLKAMFESEGKTPEEPKKKVEAGTDGDSLMGDLSAYRQQLSADKKRIAAISKVMASESVEIEVDGEKVDLEAHAIENGWTVEKVELHLLRATRAKAPAVHVGDDNVEQAVIEAALLRSVGHDENKLVKDYGEKTMEAAASKRFRGYTLQAAMGATIRAAGMSYSGAFKSNEFIKTTLQAERKILASGFSTLSLSNILENVAHKEMIAVYQAIETTWNTFCKTASMSDFKVHSRYRLDSEGSFKKVGASGELKHVSLTDTKYTNQLDTYGALISLTRQMQINDDLDAFLEIPRLISRMAAIRIEEAVYVLLLSNPSSFFATGNNNLISGGSSALSMSSLTTAKNEFRTMVDSNGKPILISPTTLLVNTTLEETADTLLTETRIIDGTSTAAQPAKNPHVGTLQKVVSPYLNNTSITDQDGAALSGQSDTQWYLFANPAVRAAMCVGFLNGQQMPTIESDDAMFTTLGMQWRGYSDFGVGMEDPVAAVKSAGQ